MLFLLECRTISVLSYPLPLHPRDGWKPCRLDIGEVSEKAAVMSPIPPRRVEQKEWEKEGVTAFLGRSGPSTPHFEPRRYWYCWNSSLKLQMLDASPQPPEDCKTRTAKPHLWALPAPTQSLFPWVMCLFRIIHLKNASETITGKSGGKLSCLVLVPPFRNHQPYWQLYRAQRFLCAFGWTAFEAVLPHVQAQPLCSHPTDLGWVAGCVGAAPAWPHGPAQLRSGRAPPTQQAPLQPEKVIGSHNPPPKILQTHLTHDACKQEREG